MRAILVSLVSLLALAAGPAKASTNFLYVPSIQGSENPFGYPGAIPLISYFIATVAPNFQLGVTTPVEYNTPTFIALSTHTLYPEIDVLIYDNIGLPPTGVWHFYNALLGGYGANYIEHTTTYGFNYASAVLVPEPSAVALMLVGMVAITGAAIVRRRS